MIKKNICSLCSCDDIEIYGVGIQSLLICNNCIEYLGHLYTEDCFSINPFLAISIFNVESGVRSLRYSLPLLVGSDIIYELVNNAEESMHKLSNLIKTTHNLPVELLKKLNDVNEELNSLIKIYK